MRVGSWGTRATFFLLATNIAAPGYAQSMDSMREVRSLWGGHAGLLAYGTGDDVNCDTGAGLSAGAEVRTRGAWLGAVGVDVLLAAAACTEVGVITDYGGEVVNVFSGTHLLGSPRLRVRGGRAFTAGNLTVEPSLGAGLIYSPTDFVGEDRWLWNAWAGGSVTVRGPGIPLGLEVEYGRHQVPIRYYRNDDGWEVVHEFRRWKPFLRLSVVL